MKLKFLSLFLGTLFLFACSKGLYNRFELPKPMGKFPVGTKWFYFVDTEREETFTSDPSDHRAVAFRVWYPAKVSRKNERCNYLEKTALEAESELPEEIRAVIEKLNERLSKTKTHSYKDADIANSDGRFEVILYSHGYWAGMNQSTILMEELASRGYVAVSIGHPFETNKITKPDGGVVRFNPQNPEFMLRGQEREIGLRIERAITQTTNPSEIDSLFRELMSVRPKMIESLEIWTRDISFVIDKFEALNSENGIFEGKVDLSRIGAMGHSFGGIAAGQACLSDSRIKAGINMDGVQVGDMIDVNIDKPFMFMHHDNKNVPNKTLNIMMFRRAEGPAYMVVIEGSGHYNFSDFSLPSISQAVPVPEGALGSIEGRRFIDIMNKYVTAFFDIYLKGIDAALLDGPSQDYPEVDIQTINIR